MPMIFVNQVTTQKSTKLLNSIWLNIEQILRHTQIADTP
jgi:hypothetical protein